MKKQLLLLLALLLSLCVFPHDFEVNGIYYNYLTDNNGTSVVVTYKGTSYTSKAYSGSVTIPKTVTYNGNTYLVECIGNSAFYGCTGLISINMGGNVTNIETFAFALCSGLTTITFSDNIKTIAAYAFEGCSALTSVLLPENLEQLGQYAVDDNGNHSYTYHAADEDNDASWTYQWYKSPFPGCSSLTSFKIAGRNTSFLTIDGVLYSKSGKVLLEFPKAKGPSFVMPEGVKYTNDYVFQDCCNLQNLTLSDDLQLGFGVFAGNDYLETLNVGSNLTAYNDKNTPSKDNVSSVLADLSSLVTISVSDPNSSLEVYSGALYRKNDDDSWALLCYPKKRTNTELEVSDNCAIVEADVFANHYYLQNVILPEGVKTIGMRAFNGCSNLQTVSIPSTITTIEEKAFYRCQSLTGVNISDLKAWCTINFMSDSESYDPDANPLYYAHHLYLNGEEVTELVIPDGTIGISSYAFWGGSNIISVVIPDKVTTVGSCSFSDCSNLTSVTFGKDVANIWSYAFDGCNKLTSVTVKASKPIWLDSWAIPNRANATLHVPLGSKSAYEAAIGWKDFKEIIEDKKCATPSISLVGGKLHFECETEGVEFHYEFTAPASGNGTGNDVAVSSTYVVNVYASKEGYTDSDVTTANVNVAGLKGDVDDDGVLDISDAVKIVNMLVGKNN